MIVLHNHVLLYSYIVLQYVPHKIAMTAVCHTCCWKISRVAQSSESRGKIKIKYIGSEV